MKKKSRGVSANLMALASFFSSASFFKHDVLPALSRPSSRMRHSVSDLRRPRKSANKPAIVCEVLIEGNEMQRSCESTRSIGRNAEKRDVGSNFASAGAGSVWGAPIMWRTFRVRFLGRSCSRRIDPFVKPLHLRSHRPWQCRSSSRPSRARPSRSTSSRLTRSRTSRPKSRTRRVWNILEISSVV
jgi:hypothetical protein